jgi:hypothetical protein
MYGSVDTCTDCCWLKAAVDFSKTITRAGLTAYLPGESRMIYMLQLIE